MQERGPERGAGVVAGAPGIGVRARRVAQRLPRAGRPRRRGQNQRALCAGSGSAGRVFVDGRSRTRSGFLRGAVSNFLANLIDMST